MGAYSAASEFAGLGGLDDPANPEQFFGANSTATARLAAAVACSGAADRLPCPATTPPTRKTAATRQVAMI